MTREEIIKSNIGLVYNVANQFYNVDKQDLIQAGCMGLIDAYNNYQNNGTTKFSTYAYTYVYGKMYETVNKNRDIKVSRDILKLYKLIEKSRYMLAQKIGKIPSNLELANYLEKDEREIEEAVLCGEAIMMGSLDSQNVDERSKYETIATPESISLDDRIDVIDSLEVLNDSEREIIKSRYFNDMTQSEVARKLNMTQVMVSRYEKKSLDKMRMYMTV